MATYSVKFSWHRPFGQFSTRRAAEREAKLLRADNRRAGLKGAVKVVRSKENAGSFSSRKKKKRFKGLLTPRQHVKRNVKGRKAKGGGRAVTLRNFTGTVVRRRDGTVDILGKGRR